MLVNRWRRRGPLESFERSLARRTRCAIIRLFVECEQREDPMPDDGTQFESLNLGELRAHPNRVSPGQRIALGAHGAAPRLVRGRAAERRGIAEAIPRLGWRRRSHDRSCVQRIYPATRARRKSRSRRVLPTISESCAGHSAPTDAPSRAAANDVHECRHRGNQKVAQHRPMSVGRQSSIPCRRPLEPPLRPKRQKFSRH